MIVPPKPEDLPMRTMEMVGWRLGISKQAVNFHEQNALRKLRNHPIIKDLARAYGILRDEEELAS